MFSNIIKMNVLALLIILMNAVATGKITFIERSELNTQKTQKQVVKKKSKKAKLAKVSLFNYRPINRFLNQ